MLAALVVNLYPFGADSATELLVALHLPVVLWFVVAYPYMGGTLRSHERRMDFVRFTGEWFIYYVLIALGGGVLVGLTALILQPIGADRRPAGRRVGAAVGRGRRGDRRRVARGVQAAGGGEHGAGADDALHAAVRRDADRRRGHLRRVPGSAAAFDRELLGVFDALLVVVLGLVLYAMSAREPVDVGRTDGPASSWSRS